MVFFTPFFFAFGFPVLVLYGEPYTPGTSSIRIAWHWIINFSFLFLLFLFFPLFRSTGSRQALGYIVAIENINIYLQFFFFKEVLLFGVLV